MLDQTPIGEGLRGRHGPSTDARVEPPRACIYIYIYIYIHMQTETIVMKCYIMHTGLVRHDPLYIGTMHWSEMEEYNEELVAVHE